MKTTLLMIGPLMFLMTAGSPAKTSEFVWTPEGLEPAPIILPEDPTEENLIAATTLADYVEKISGNRPDLVLGTESTPDRAVWIGINPALAAVLPDADLEFPHPEEILILSTADHLVIAGRDRLAGEEEIQVEFGTANAVYTFLHDHLEVRWFMPWPDSVWEDYPVQEAIVIPEMAWRFHPPFRRWVMHPSRPVPWDRFHRLRLDSYSYHAGHGFTDWWEKYHEEHPDWFALRPDGSRTPQKWGDSPNPQAAKLCVSNPGVARQWIDNAEKLLNAHPERSMVSASPNDGGGFCVCDYCRAWDHPDAPPGVLTERYVKFWNILARGLKERFPDREVYVGAYAYSAYKSPPISAELEPNIVIGYVGHFPLAHDELSDREKADWLAWADKASAIVFRPNLFHYSGGWIGLPTLSMNRTIEDFRFLAENQCIGLEVDTLPHSWATQGLQYYVMARLAYDPLQDGPALLNDFYQRAFGPAATPIKAYFELMEEAHERVLKDIRHSSGWAREAVAVYQKLYTPDLLEKARTLLEQAAEAAADAPEKFPERIAYLTRGFEIVDLQIEIMQVMQRVRESEGKDVEAVTRAVELCALRDERIAKAGVRFPEFYQRRVPDHLGPPSERFLEAAGIK